MNARSALTAAVVLSTLSGAAFAQLGYSTPNSAYTNTFDSLASANNNNAWANNSTFVGWHLFRQAGTLAPVAITTYNAGTGSSNTGNFWSFGSAGAAERALGGVASGGAYFGSPATGSVAGWIAFAVTNTTGGGLGEFSISFDGEQWRDGGTTNVANPAVAQTMVLEYGFGASFDTVATWTAPGGNFDWTSPVITNNTTSGAAVDGNAAGLVAGRGGTISNLTWNNGDTLWIRWIERNDANNDHGLAIDNFHFSADVPTPGAAALIGLGGLLVGRRRR